LGCGQNAKLLDRQNRLGFVVTWASQLRPVERTAPFGKASDYLGVLERSRLVRKILFAHDSLTEAERKWLRSNRPAKPPWNLLNRHEAEISPPCHALARHQTMAFLPGELDQEATGRNAFGLVHADFVVTFFTD